MKKIRLLLMIALSCVIVAPAFAQRIKMDPRPLSGRPAGLPVYGSIAEYLRANPPSGIRLSSQATVVGRAVWTPMSLASASRIPVVADAMNRAVPPRVQRAANGTVSWMTAPSLGRIPEKSGAGVQATQLAAMSVLKNHSATLRLNDPETQLKVMSTQTDNLGFSHVRFQQVWQGIPVWGSDLYVHFDAGGNAYAINGRYQPSGDAQITATFTSDEVLQIVIADLKSRERWAPVSDQLAANLKIDAPSVEMVIYPKPDGTRILAYDVILSANLLERYEYIVAATGGQIANRIPLFCNLTGSEPKHPATAYTFAIAEDGKAGLKLAASAGFASASATDLNNKTQQIRTYQHTDGKFYMVWDLPNLNTTKSQLPNNPDGGSMVLSANNQDLGQNTTLLSVTSTGNTWSDKTSVSAAVDAKLSYDYYKNTHSRNAIDGKDESMISVIHVTESGQPMDNAFWTGRVMAYGDGQSAFKPLAGSLDVAGHEMTHGVTEHTAGLIYQDQSGALNESFSDVFGVMIDPTDFLIGDNIMQSGQGIALRDLLNPDNPQVNSPQPAHMNNYNPTTQDNGGVHTNSGIPNRAAGLIIQAIGRPKTEKIYYRALTNYLTRNSQFIDCRNAVEQSAKDLFGDAAEAGAVRTAFTAVGVGSGSGSNGGGNDVPPQSGGTSLIAFSVANGQIGIFDLVANTVGLFSSSDAIARVSTVGSTIDRAQISVTLNGKSLYFVNQSGQLAMIDVPTGAVSIFTNLRLQQAGDIWNASISPDDNFVTLVSSYSNDPNLYIFNGTSISTIPLKPETSQNGIEDNSIQYPDVVSWSPNMKDPRIAFDALRAIDIGTGKITFWSMYEINFASGKIFDLVPAQSSDVSVGNVVYSSINPDIIAFNYIDDKGLFDVIISNFESGAETLFGLPTKTLGGTAIVDGERPTFSPDGKNVCLTSPAHTALLFGDLSGNLSAVTFQQALYNPVWFSLGGHVGVDDAAGAADAGLRLNSVIPNPFSSSAIVSYSIPRTSRVTLQVSDVMGRTVATLIDEQKAAGTGSVRFDGVGLPSGTYMLRLRAGTMVRTQQVTISR